jgi:peptidyl-prolyl cis-trans isomerase A (cyclophilin A)
VEGRSILSVSLCWRATVIGSLSIAICLACGSSAKCTIVRFTTSSGNVDVRLYNTTTPNSVTNFLNYVNSNRYSGSFIHRVPQTGKDAQGNNLGTSHFVVQGGGFLLNNSIWAASGIVTDAPIGDEFHISNTRGTLAFAKNSLGATSQWFFNVGNNTFLDSSNFTVFGRVLGSGMTVVDTIDNLPAINAAVAENAPGEDFDEIPLRNPLTQNDITSNEAVMVSVAVLNYRAGDYDFNGVVNGADYILWRKTLNSTTNPAADGNGNGIVDAADYTIWRNTFGQSDGPGSGSGAGLGLDSFSVPEPSSGLLILLSGAMLTLYRSKMSARRTNQMR